jgi:ATP-binding cassette subfamily C protein
MSDRALKQGKAELDAAIGKGRGLFLSVFVFSIFVNILMLTGSLFMLQVYDRVLGSRSEETLVALSVLVAALYVLMGVLEYARGRVAARIGARFQETLDPRVFDAVLRRAVLPDERSRPSSGLKDVEAIQRFLSSPVLFAIFDMPWTPVFIAAIFVFHPLLGWLAVAGGAILIVITLLNQMATRKPTHTSHAAAQQSDEFAETMREEAELLQGLGMRKAALARWKIFRDKALEAQIALSDRSGTYTTASKTFRFFLQSAMLALGAWIVLQGEMTAGAMIAGSILMGRALAPVEQAIGGWPMFQRAREGWKNLIELLGTTPSEADRLPLPAPKAILDVHQITVVPPSEKQATLRMLSFRVEPGQAIGVIGPSAAGKSTLARVLVGIWRPASGKIRLDGASLEQYGTEDIGRHIGYLPQDVTIFSGTVAENIARLGSPDPAKVIEAAKKAGAHEMILKLPNGYDTFIASGGGRLSGGQRQRLGLARAMYGNPVLLVLDEPNSNLDAQGSAALNTAIRQMKAEGKSVIIMAHRPAGIAECDMILVIDNGIRKDFGPRDQVLKAQIKNYDQIAQTVRAAELPSS